MEPGLTRLKWQVLSQGAERKVRSWARNEPSTLSALIESFTSTLVVHFRIVSYNMDSHNEDALVSPPLGTTQDIPTTTDPEEADAQAAAIDVPDDTGEGGKLRMIVQLVKRSFGVKDLAAMWASSSLSLSVQCPLARATPHCPHQNHSLYDLLFVFAQAPLVTRFVARANTQS